MADSLMALIISCGYVGSRRGLVWTCGVVTAEVLAIPDMVAAEESSLIGLAMAAVLAMLGLGATGLISDAKHVKFKQ